MAQLALRREAADQGRRFQTLMGAVTQGIVCPGPARGDHGRQPGRGGDAGPDRRPDARPDGRRPGLADGRGRAAGSLPRRVRPDPPLPRPLHPRVLPARRSRAACIPSWTTRPSGRRPPSPCACSGRPCAARWTASSSPTRGSRTCRWSTATPAFSALTGYDEAEVLGRNCRFLQGEGADPEARRQIREALEAGRACRVTLQNQHKDGTPFWNELTLSPLRDGAGAVTHYVGVQHDVTEVQGAAAGAALGRRTCCGRGGSACAWPWKAAGWARSS